MQLICTIENVFHITGRGCVVVPGIPYDFPIPVGIGAQLLIETPSGEHVRSTFAGVEMINRGKPMNHAPFSVPSNITKNQLPVGSKVFLVEDEHA